MKEWILTYTEIGGMHIKGPKRPVFEESKSQVIMTIIIVIYWSNDDIQT